MEYELESDNHASSDTHQPLELEVIVPMPVAKYAVPSSIGEPLKETIAQTIVYMMGEKLEEKSIEVASNKYPCLKNCEALEVPKVNTSVWENLTSAVGGRDLKLQAIQKSHVKGWVALPMYLSHQIWPRSCQMY